MKGRFVFIKYGAFSHINDKVLEQLRKRFPGMEADVIDLSDEFGICRLARKRPLVFAANLAAVARSYGTDVLLGKQRIGDCFFRTGYLFGKIKSYVSSRLSGKEYAFSFQTQSWFDGSVDGLPHFLYTDHTHLENLKYRGFERSALSSPEWIELERSVYKNAAVNFTMSRNIADSMVKDYSCDPGRVSCVYAGSNVPSGFKVNGKKYSSKNILFVGAEWERKGGPDLAKAFEKVLSKHPDARLTVVGTSPRLDLPNCEVAGRVPVGKINDHYEGACVFCLPSRREPFGIVFIEAFMHGLPVVSTRIGAIPEMVKDGETGYLVDCGSVDDLADRLSDLVIDPGRCRRMGEKGMRFMKSRYTWDKAGEKMASAIKKKLGRRAGVPRKGPSSS